MARRGKKDELDKTNPSTMTCTAEILLGLATRGWKLAVCVPAKK
jgi:hypothetical protein